ncbi:sensor histidine kinase [Jeotgalibaca porci]|uniref:sensor histidine kinase n=1 Tax=Jeotgalibaca porci TaxID=1868793 RepID=UPI0035A18FEB
MTIFKSFLSSIRPQAVIFGVAVLCFGIVSLLLRFPSAFFWYSFLLLIAFTMLYWVFQWLRYSEKYRNVQYEYALEGDYTALEQLYLAKVAQLEEVLRDQEQADYESKQEQLDYFTLWLHQIKTPIAVMSLLQQQLPHSESKKQIEQELIRVEDYTHMALSYLKLEGSTQELELVEVELDAVIRKVIKKYASLFIYNHIQLEYEPLKLKVVSDGKWLEVIVEQLLSNSLKYAVKGKISIYAEGASLVIADNGPGIRSEDLPKVFEKGYTGLSGRLHEKSTGLGLFLSRKICKRLGHRLEIESEVGKYTKAILHLDQTEMRLFD